jgi:RNA polymerase sigma factor (sigma-70 family)
LPPNASMRVVAAINGHRSGREVTWALVERAACGELGARLRSQVAAWRPGATGEQVEEAVQQACLLATRSCRGQSEREVFAWLRITARRELARSRRRERREVPVDAAALGQLPEAAVAPAPEQELIEREADVEVDRVARAVLERLSDRQREIVALHARGRKRPQIAVHLGLTPRTVKRQLERIMTVGRAELVHLAGRGCEVGEPMVARLAFGLASPREAGQAQLHLATCAQCGALYERLDLWRERVAALLPIPAVEPAHPGLVEWALQRTSEAFAGVKQHVTAGYVRAVDPTPVAGARPGAAVAAIVGCLAIGGGTTYCVTQNVDPLGGLAQVVSPAREQKSERDAPRRRRQAQTSSVPTATATPTPTPVPTPTTEPPTTIVQATPEPTPQPTAVAVPEEEYEPVAAATTATAPPSPPPARTPAPAPPGGPGEFDGP